MANGRRIAEKCVILQAQMHIRYLLIMIKRFFLIVTALIATAVAGNAGVLDSVKVSTNPLGVSCGENFSFNLTGYAQMHYELTSEDGKTTNDFQVKKVILTGNMRVVKRLLMSVMVDVANSRADRRLQEAYAQWEFWPELKVRIGQYKQPFMLENLCSPSLLGELNMTEGTKYMCGIGGDPLQGAMSGRDIGLMVTGDAFRLADGRRLLGYSLGVFNGCGLNMRDNNSAKDVIGMLQVRPLKELTLSTSFILGRGHAIEASPYGDIEKDQNYNRRRWSIGADAAIDRFKLRTEYTRGWNGDVKSQAFYAEAACRLVGGLEAVAVFDHLNRNTALSTEQQRELTNYTSTCNYTIGLQYWIWRRCRVASQYIFSDRKTGPDCHQWVTQVQFAF